MSDGSTELYVGAPCAQPPCSPAAQIESKADCCTILTWALLSCRAAMPVVTAAVAVFVERKVPSKTEVTALLLLVSGVIISVFEGQASGSSYGITLSITGKHRAFHGCLLNCLLMAQPPRIGQTLL